MLYQGVVEMAHAFQNILVVCIGNICRSPMAEALLRARAPAGVTVHSAGIGALSGSAADPIACALMVERGIDISAHRGRQIDADMIRNADLILVMEHGHQKHLQAIAPASHGKVQLLGRWTEHEIADPYRQPRARFETVLSLIEQGVESWAAKLWKQP